VTLDFAHDAYARREAVERVHPNRRGACGEPWTRVRSPRQQSQFGAVHAAHSPVHEQSLS